MGMVVVATETVRVARTITPLAWMEAPIAISARQAAALSWHGLPAHGMRSRILRASESTRGAAAPRRPAAPRASFGRVRPNDARTRPWASSPCHDSVGTPSLLRCRDTLAAASVTRLAPWQNHPPSLFMRLSAFAAQAQQLARLMADSDTSQASPNDRSTTVLLDMPSSSMTCRASGTARKQNWSQPAISMSERCETPNCNGSGWRQRVRGSKLHDG